MLRFRLGTCCLLSLACTPNVESTHPTVSNNDPPKLVDASSAPVLVDASSADVSVMDASVVDASVVDAAPERVWPPPHAGFVAKFAGDVCFGDCPVYTVTVHANGAFVIAVTSPRKGCIQGTAPVDRVGKIEELGREADFNHLRATYETSQHDRRWMTTTLTLDGRTHTIRRWGFDKQDDTYAKIVAVENAIEEATSASSLAEKGTLSACPKGP
jgi:Domain of unknown function (DUF6438)